MLHASIPSIAFVVYIGGIYSVNEVMETCSSLSDRSVMYQWIKVEQFVFSAAVLALLIFMSLYWIAHKTGLD